MRILIVGAGIAGLTAAALLQDTHDVTIIEKQKQPGKGYAIGIWANCLPVFEQLGIREKILKKGSVNPDYWHLDREGLPLVYADFGQEPMIVQIAHTDLRSLLEKQVRNIHYETEFDGNLAAYDLVIGADGMHSHMRERYVAHTRTSVGWTATYGWSTVPKNLPAQVTEAWKPGAMIGMYSHGKTKGCTIAFTPNGVGLEVFSDFEGIAQDIVESFGETHTSELYWVNCKKPYAGNVLLLGDAAHAMPPFGGVGGTMAIEDAWVLSQVLTEDIDASLRAYHRRRTPRLALAKKQTLQQWKWKKIRNPTLGKLRNFIAPFIPISYFMKGFEKLVHQKP